MDALLNATDPAAAPVHAVVTTEQQLYQRGASLADAKDKLVASWLPPGPTAIADYPTVLLGGHWLSQEQVSRRQRVRPVPAQAGSARRARQAGFRADGGETAARVTSSSFAPLSAPLSVGDTAMRATLANALTAPARQPGRHDHARPVDDRPGGRQDPVGQRDRGARRATADAAADVGGRAVDLRRCRRAIRGATGPLSDPVDGKPRSAALAAALDGQTASGGGAVSFTTLRLIYGDAMAKFRQGQTNSVLVITAGPHTDQTPRRQRVCRIRASRPSTPPARSRSTSSTSAPIPTARRGKRSHKPAAAGTRTCRHPRRRIWRRRSPRS